MVRGVTMKTIEICDSEYKRLRDYMTKEGLKTEWEAVCEIMDTSEVLK